GQAGQPEAAVGGERLLGGEVVDVEGARVDGQAAGPGGGVHAHQTLGPGGPADRHHHPGRGLGGGEGVEVARGIGPGFGVAAERGRDHLGLVQVGGGGGGGGELGRELAEHQGLGAPVHQRGGGQVPQQGRSAGGE